MPQANRIGNEFVEHEAQMKETTLSGVRYKFVYESTGPWVCHKDGKPVRVIEGIRFAGLTKA